MHPLRKKWGDTFSRWLIYYSTPAQKPAQCELTSHRKQIFEHVFEQAFEQPFKHVFEQVFEPIIEQVFEHIPLKMDSS